MCSVGVAQAAGTCVRRSTGVVPMLSHFASALSRIPWGLYIPGKFLLTSTNMAFQVNIPNEATWAKEIGSSQTGVIQGVHLALKDHVLHV